MLKKLIFAIIFCLIVTNAFAETPIEKYAHSKRFIDGGGISLINNRHGNGGSIKIIIDTQEGLEYHIYTTPDAEGTCLLNVYRIDLLRVKEWQNPYKPMELNGK